MKKYSAVLVPFFFVLLSLLALTISAYLVYYNYEESNIEIGLVDAAVRVYFSDNDPDTPEEHESYFFTATNPAQDSHVKTGIVKVNIHNPEDIQFVKNLRADVIVASNVDTFIRVAPFIQFTLTYDVHEETYEKALTQDDFFRLNYNLNDFYDNRTADSYFYLYHRVKKGSSENIVIPLIQEYFDEEFRLYEDRFSLQIGFIIEAVQYIDGPLRNWDQEVAPWGESWGDIEAMEIDSTSFSSHDSTLKDVNTSISNYKLFAVLPSKGTCFDLRKWRNN